MSARAWDHRRMNQRLHMHPPICTWTMYDHDGTGVTREVREVVFGNGFAVNMTVKTRRY